MYNPKNIRYKKIEYQKIPQLNLTIKINPLY